MPVEHGAMGTSLNGRRALVTGANQGIGRAIAALFSAEGAHVVALCRREDAARECVAALGDASFVLAELTDPPSTRAACALLSTQSIDIVVNNAGIYDDDAILGGDEDAFRRAMEVHYFAPLLLCRATVPGMLARGFGRVVNVSSGYGSFGEGLAGPPAYATSKAALQALTKKLADEVSGDVTVNAMCPGWVRTRMGGTGAPIAPEQPARAALALVATGPKGPNGGFFRDGQAIPW
jgi:NAD(P)-dependent dehydrogenase (short-subunit alcohol dehydrogenase family)